MLSPLFKCLYVKWPFGVCHLRWYSQPVTRSWKLFRLWHRINGYLGCFGKGPFRQFFSQFLSQWLIQLSVGEVGTYDKCVFHICFSDAFIYIYTYLNMLRNSWANVSAEVKLTHADVQPTNIRDYPAKSVTFGMKLSKWSGCRNHVVR